MKSVPPHMMLSRRFPYRPIYEMPQYQKERKKEICIPPQECVYKNLSLFAELLALQGVNNSAADLGQTCRDANQKPITPSPCVLDASLALRCPSLLGLNDWEERYTASIPPSCAASRRLPRPPVAHPACTHRRISPPRHPPPSSCPRLELVSARRRCVGELGATVAPCFFKLGPSASLSAMYDLSQGAVANSKRNIQNIQQPKSQECLTFQSKNTKARSRKMAPTAAHRETAAKPGSAFTGEERHSSTFLPSQPWRRQA